MASTSSSALRPVHLISATATSQALGVNAQGALAMVPLDNATVFMVEEPCTGGMAQKLSFRSGDAYLRHADDFSLRLSNAEDTPISFERQTCFSVNSAQACVEEGALHIQATSDPTLYLYWTNDGARTVSMKRVDFGNDSDVAQTCFLVATAQNALREIILREAEQTYTPHNPTPNLEEEASNLTNGAATRTDDNNRFRELSSLPENGTSDKGATTQSASLNESLGKYAFGNDPVQANESAVAADNGDTTQSPFPIWGFVLIVVAVVGAGAGGFFAYKRYKKSLLRRQE